MHSPTQAWGSFGRAITPTLSYGGGHKAGNPSPVLFRPRPGELAEN